MTQRDTDARPQRMCIATRTVAPAGELLRVVVDRQASLEVSTSTGHDIAVVVPDPGKVLPGRGASITPTVAAVELAHTRRAFARALKVSAPVDISRVAAWVAQHHGDGTAG